MSNVSADLNPKVMKEKEWRAVHKKHKIKLKKTKLPTGTLKYLACEDCRLLYLLGLKETR